jgi:hypothetical protein
VYNMMVLLRLTMHGCTAYCSVYGREMLLSVAYYRSIWYGPDMEELAIHKTMTMRA